MSHTFKLRSSSQQIPNHPRPERRKRGGIKANGRRQTSESPSSTPETASGSQDTELMPSSTLKGRRKRVVSSSRENSIDDSDGSPPQHRRKRRTLSRTAVAVNNARYEHPSRPYQAGDLVEALKWTETGKEWYCARVVTILDDGTPVGNNGNEGADSPRNPTYFVHFEGWTADHADWVDASRIRWPSPQPDRRLQYGPNGRESNVSWEEYRTFYYSTEAATFVKHHTGLVQDQRMLWHSCPCHSLRNIHPERPDRIASILQALHRSRLLRYFHRIQAREATIEELLNVHAFNHILNYCPTTEKAVQEAQDKLMTESNTRTTSALSIPSLLNSPTNSDTSPSPASEPESSQDKDMLVRRTHGVEGGEVVKADKNRIKQQRRRFSTAAAKEYAQNGLTSLVTPPANHLFEMNCGELGVAVDTPFHPLYSSVSARVAAGGLIELVNRIVEGDLHNGFALIRPPGHHAEDNAAMGFCFFNNVAVAVSSTLKRYPSKIKKIAIIDWDIHHGNGTQKIFYDNPDVLYISLHRWDEGKFYPFSGAPSECGEGKGLGRNVNIAFTASTEKPKPMGDAEFLAAFHHLVLPIVRQFGPDMIFVSAGFDAAEGHPANIGGYKVTPRGYALLTKMTKDLAEEICEGRLVMSLEGGYELEPLANSAAACVEQLIPAQLVPDAQLTYENSLGSIKPNRGAVQSLRQVVEIQREYWNLPEELSSPEYRFMLPAEWKANMSVTIRPKRTTRPVLTTAVEGY